MAVDTTQPEYWLNWRFLLCALWVYSCMALAFFLIKKYEVASSPDSNGDDGGDREEALPCVRPGVVYLEDCWKTCLEGIHPGWLLAFRVVAFFVLASLLVVDIITDGWSIFLYYTQTGKCRIFTFCVGYPGRPAADWVGVLSLVGSDGGRASMAAGATLLRSCGGGA
uniref:Uncharacterized protein n=1 Tax=Zea mays TaxID=4577 RepID=A0A804LQJ3_MAIZE